METVENQSANLRCLPFSSIPHSTRLFVDFVDDFENVSPFYSRPPLSRTWWEEEKLRIVYPEARRQAVASVLERQNREFGAGDRTLENIQRFRAGAPVVVTGQQVGLFGGPLFSLLKALSVFQQSQESGAVPVFWLASEDHDFDEINFTHLPADGQLRKWIVNVPHHEGAPVGTIVFNDEISARVQELAGAFGASNVSALLESSYGSGETFSSSFATFYAKILADTGIIFLDPLDPELHRMAGPLYRQALEKSQEINESLEQRDRELESAGYHAQVKVTPSHTLCFHVEEGDGDGARLPIRIESEGFQAGSRKFSRAELLAEVERCPERFSANVLLRPVVQDFLLPTLAYVGGPAEIAYFAQAEVVYRCLAGRVTPILPRIFATLIEPRQAKLLKRYDLDLPDIFVPPEKLREAVATRSLPNGVTQSFDAADSHLDRALEAIQPALESLDPTLLDAAEHAGSKIRHHLQTLRDKAARAEARKNSELERDATELSMLLYPNKELQEREIAAAYFLLKYGTGLVDALNQLLKVWRSGHQAVVLDLPRA